MMHALPHGAVFTLWIGVRGSMRIGTLARPDRIAARYIAFSTGEPRLDLWWAPGDAQAPLPAVAGDGCIDAAMRSTLAGPAPDRVRIARKTIDGLTRLAEEARGATDLQSLRQAFDQDIRAFETLLARDAQAGHVGSLDDWIAIASLAARIDESRKELEAKLVMRVLP